MNQYLFMMKKLLFLLFTTASLFSFAGNKQLNIGDQAKHTTEKMQCVSGTSFALNDLKQENGLLVIFSCNTCPFVLKWEDRFNSLKEYAEKNDIGMVLLNSNYQKRSGSESYEAMQKHAQDKNYKFPYLVDKESLIANAYGGQTTPHVFLFNGDFKLAYKGAIDDNYNDASKVNKSYLKEAIHAIASKQTVKLAETKPVGCSIKRKLD